MNIKLYEGDLSPVSPKGEKQFVQWMERLS